eukprot:TRINITY_DN10960_c1_g1_i1.p1 TRINITY_DN10960_c1_g1~~TRINITY_DN10960_c1_g1_i1.p1  ORF type:complete len:246 (+),score=29.05 TRINITY_DN10960_c1_g1_i1:53-739(+)
MSPNTAQKTTSNKITPNNYIRHQLPPPMSDTAPCPGVFGQDGCFDKPQPCILATAPRMMASPINMETHGSCFHVTPATAPSSGALDQDDYAQHKRPGKSATKKHPSWLAQQAYTGAYCTVRSRMVRDTGRAVVALPSNSLSELGLMILRRASRSGEAEFTIDGTVVAVEMNMKFPGWFLRWNAHSQCFASLNEERIASAFDGFIEQLKAIERSECAPMSDMVPMCNLN